MTINASGCLYFSPALAPFQERDILALFHEDFPDDVVDDLITLNGSSISFEDVPGLSELDLRKLCDYCTAQKLYIKGRIEYYGDVDGYLVVDGAYIEDMTREEYGAYVARSERTLPAPFTDAELRILSDALILAIECNKRAAQFTSSIRAKDALAAEQSALSWLNTKVCGMMADEC